MDKNLIQEVKEFVTLLAVSAGLQPPELKDEDIAKQLHEWLPEATDADHGTDAGKPGEQNEQADGGAPIAGAEGNKQEPAKQPPADAGKGPEQKSTPGAK